MYASATKRALGIEVGVVGMSKGFSRFDEVAGDFMEVAAIRDFPLPVEAVVLGGEGVEGGDVVVCGDGRRGRRRRFEVF